MKTIYVMIHSLKTLADSGQRFEIRSSEKSGRFLEARMVSFNLVTDPFTSVFHVVGILPKLIEVLGHRLFQPRV